MNGSDIVQILDLIKHFGLRKGDDMLWAIPKIKLMSLGYKVHLNYLQMDEKIKQLVKMGLIKLKNDIIFMEEIQPSEMNALW